MPEEGEWEPEATQASLSDLSDSNKNEDLIGTLPSHPISAECDLQDDRVLNTG